MTQFVAEGLRHTRPGTEPCITEHSTPLGEDSSRYEFNIGATLCRRGICRPQKSHGPCNSRPALRPRTHFVRLLPAQA
jgi:hypothetical protein